MELIDFKNGKTSVSEETFLAFQQNIVNEFNLKDGLIENLTKRIEELEKQKDVGNVLEVGQFIDMHASENVDYDVRLEAQSDGSLFAYSKKGSKQLF